MRCASFTAVNLGGGVESGVAVAKVDAVAWVLRLRLVSEWVSIVMLLSITSLSLISAIVPVTAKSIVSPSFTSTSAWRNEPGPLSFALVTVMVVA